MHCVLSIFSTLLNLVILFGVFLQPSPFPVASLIYPVGSANHSL